MPDPGELIGRVVRFVGDILGASSLRFDAGPTLAILGLLLVFLQLVARPVTRWVTSDAGGLAAVGRATALAAEAGTDAVVTLGGAGITRSTDALARLQTVAAIPLLAHVARAAARSGVPLRVLMNDALASRMATAALETAHASTGTPERSVRSRVVMMGEGRAVMAGMVMTARARPAAAYALGSLREEATLHLEGLRSGAGSLLAGSAEAAQSPSLIIGSGSALIGPELYQAPADLRSTPDERSTVVAANRLIGIILAAALIGTLASLAGVIEPRDLLLGTSGA